MHPSLTEVDPVGPADRATEPVHFGGGQGCAQPDSRQRRFGHPGVMKESTPSRRLPARIADVAVHQDMVVTRDQLRDAGIGHEGVASRTRQGIWVELGPRVVLLQSGAPSARQRQWVGSLHGGRDAVLALATAAEANGLDGFRDETVHVAIAHGREVEDIEHPMVTVKVHQTRHVTEDLVPLRTPARQTVARCVLEMASTSEFDNRSRALVAAAVQQGLTRPDALRDFVDRRRTLPKRRLLRETIGDVAGGAHSLPELAYAQALRRTGLPQPDRQSKLKRAKGAWYLDNDFDDWAVTVEVNGSQHYSLLARESDDDRRFVQQVQGRLVVDISSYVVRHRPGIAVLRTAEALLSRGYQPEPSVLAALLDLARQEDWTWLNQPFLDRPA